MSEETKTSEGGGAQARSLVGSFRRRWRLYLTLSAVGALILAAAGVYVWQNVTVRQLQARFAAERNASTSAQRQALTTQARDLLRLTARPLAWAVRAEMLRDNLGQVDDYFREFVRERGVSSLILVDKNGKIVLATNRKLETQAGDSVVAKNLLESNEVAIEETGTTLRMVVPVMSFDRRLGTLVIDYDAQAL